MASPTLVDAATRTKPMAKKKKWIKAADAKGEPPRAFPKKQSGPIGAPAKAADAGHKLYGKKG